MKHHIKKFALLLTLLVLVAPPLQAAFVTDKLLAGLYSQPDASSQPTKVLTSGTPLEILETKDGFSKVRLGDNSEGWIENQFINKEKPARVMLLQLQAKNSQLQKKLNRAERQLQDRAPGADNSAELEALKLQLADARTKIGSGQNENNSSTSEALQTRITTLEGELEATKGELSTALEAAQVPPGESVLAAENSELKERINSAAALLGVTTATTPTNSEHSTSNRFELWHIALLALAILVSFVGGVAYKNHRLAKRYGGFRI